MDTPTSPTDSQESPSTLFFCRICQSVYRQPKILPCLHSFCRPCLVETVTHGKDGTVIVCPVCSHRASLPPTGVVGIPDNVFLNRLCQEYVSEVQSNLVARSLTSEASKGSSASRYTAVRPRAAMSDSPSSRATDTSIAQGEPPPEVFSIDRGPASGQSTAKAIEAIRNMSRLQTKVLSLQGEALRVTYAIDQVNQSMLEWHQHKEDLKRAIQRRSSQIQFVIKRMEHQLISQVDGKQADDDFYAESDKSKAELRLVLKNILHEVSVLKSVQELGKDAEINALCAHLLGKSVGMAEVNMKKFHFDLDLPTKPIEETIAENFGSVKISSDGYNVFTPKIQDYSEIPVGNVTETSAEFGLNTSYDEGRETPIPEEEELEQAVIKVSQKRSSDRKSRRHMTDLGLGREDVKEYLAQFQSARETFRTRRKEILAQGQHTREDISPLRTEISRRPRSSSRKGRVQSVDRATLPVTSRSRADKPEIAGILSTTHKQSATLSPDPVEGASKPPAELPLGHQYGAAASHQVHGFIPENTTVPSPVTEEVSHPTSPRRRLVKQTSDPRYTHDMSSSPEEASDSPPSHRPSLMEQMRTRRFSNPTTSFSFGEQMSLDLLGQDRVSTRPIRRAISSAADKKAKMDFLKETWQKRKEILIQNQGFVSPDSNLPQHVGRPSSLKSPPTSPTIAQTYQSTTSPLASPDDSSKDRLQQMKSRLEHYKSELTKTNGHDSGKEEVESRVMEHIPEEPPSPQHQPQGDNLINVNVMPPITTEEQKVISTPIATAAPVTTATTDPASTATTDPASTATAVSAPATVLSTRFSQVSPTPENTQPQVTRTASSPRYTAITTTSSRYSRAYTKPAENFDVASLIAAMYSGNEKSIIHSTKASTVSPSSPTTTTQQTSPRNISTTGKLPESTDTTTTTTSSTTRVSSYIPYRYRYQSRYTTDATSDQTGQSTDSQTAQSNDSQTAQSNDSQPAQSTATHTALSNGSQSALSDNSQTALTNISQTTQSNDSETAESINSQTTQLNGSQTGQSDTNTTTDPPQPRPPRRSRYGLTARDPRRRHTTEVGKETIQAALRMISEKDAASEAQNSAGQATDALSTQPASLTAEYRSRFPYLSRTLGPSSLEDTTQPSIPPLVETEDPIEDSTISYKISARGVTTRTIPSPLSLEPRLESSSPDQTQGLESQASAAMPTSPSPSPTLPSASTVALKGKLRELARKKRERWRHLTIH